MGLTELRILPLEADRPKARNLHLGEVFTARMFTRRYADGLWHDATIGSFDSLALSPATSVFHYGQAVFEGCKAFRRPDGRISLFRPQDHVRRFNRSARRVALPAVDEAEHLAALVSLVALEQAWIPAAPDSSLYLRPCLFATDAALGVDASKTCLHAIIACPLLAAEVPVTPLAVQVCDDYHRAGPGGTGDVKVAGNYAASLCASEAAKTQGYDQVLWLDAVYGRYVEEVGTMNIFAVYAGRYLVTPPLTGTILPGITRDCVLKLAPDLGYSVSEAPMDIDTLLADIRAGQITEVFGTGTAAVVAPVGRLGRRGEDYGVGDGGMGPVTRRLRQTLMDIQSGRAPDPRGWTLTLGMTP